MNVDQSLSPDHKVKGFLFPREIPVLCKADLRFFSNIAIFACPINHDLRLS